MEVLILYGLRVAPVFVAIGALIGHTGVGIAAGCLVCLAIFVVGFAIPAFGY